MPGIADKTDITVEINFDVAAFRSGLLEWFDKNARRLPWRSEKNWYVVLLSEFMLQQTQVEQALPYYKKFIAQYPDINKLARADEQDILRLWAGLGYYSRARNLLKTAKILKDQYNSRFPGDYNQVIKLPGIGKYTASAILSIAFQKPLPVVDGNVIRVLTRLFAIDKDIRNNKVINSLTGLAQQLLDNRQPGNHNEAMMEIGALICKVKNPVCNICPLFDFCAAGKGNNWYNFPFKSSPVSKRILRELAYIFSDNNHLVLAQRPAKGLLASMWECPSVILADEETIEGKLKKLFLADTPDDNYVISPLFRHSYSHILLHYQAIHINSAIENYCSKDHWQRDYQKLENIPFGEISNYPIHTAHMKLINWFLKTKSQR
ncbi:MAG: A/G-specific adenine glycosylase [Calditrichaceae bacterium]|nr:A/G-specific adenine glycosylase [Calditrichaceae bacterium]MBN2709348.1 A/G-specific adenine glycosylase [Calditrichaceae bacterium]